MCTSLWHAGARLRALGFSVLWSQDDAARAISMLTWAAWALSIRLGSRSMWETDRTQAQRAISPALKPYSFPLRFETPNEFPVAHAPRLVEALLLWVLRISGSLVISL